MPIGVSESPAGSDLPPPGRLTELLEIQRDLAFELLRGNDLETCLEMLLTAALRLPGFDCGGIYLCDEATGGLRLISHRGLSEDFVRQVSWHPAESRQNRLIQAGALVYALRDELPPEVAANLAREGLEAIAVLPLRARGQVVAALNVSSHCYPQINPESRIALESIFALAEGSIQTMQALREAREQLEARVAARTAELAAANAALQVNTARLVMALDASAAGMWELDLVTGSLEWDLRSRRMFGVADNLVISHEQVMSERIHPADRERLRCQIAAVTASDTDNDWNHEFRILHPTLGERWILGLGQVDRDAAGQPYRMKGLNLDITDRKWTEQALRQSEEKYRTLHQTMRDAFVRTDMAGRILESNQTYQDLLGYTSEELSRLTYMDLTPARWHAAESRLVEAQILQHDYSEIYEKEYQRKDGTILPVELRTFLIRDAAGKPTSMWAIVRDVTERKATEEITRQWQQTLERRLGERAQQLLQSEARFRQLAEATFEGIVISEEGVILDGNPQLAAMFGYELPEMIGRSLLDFAIPESRAAFVELLRDNTQQPYEWTGLRQDGSQFPLAANPRIRNWQGRTIRITALRDLTESKRAAAKAHAQQTELEQAQRLALISEISAGIIHQLSQPITAIGTNLAVALAQSGTCERQSCQSLDILGEMQAEISRMREIVIHLRALANPEQPSRLPLDFNSVIGAVLPLLQREASNRQIRLETALAPIPLPLLADAVQLKQVILNLTRNAFDACAACPPPRRVVALATRAIPKQGIELTVRDAGSGIAPADESRLFTLFFTTKQEGRGIGLRLCRTIIHAHDGSIEAANNPDGIGAVFRVLLPAAFNNLSSPP